MSSVIVAGARTPIGRLSGAFTSLAGTDLGGLAIGAAMERAGVRPDDVDYVIMGQVLQAGVGQAPARQASNAAGIPLTVPSTTVNKVCISGMNAVYLAERMIENGDAEIVVAGGMESMTNAPFLLPGARQGFRLGDATAVDALMHDGLWCALEHCSMGSATERYAATTSIDRDRQDAFSAASHERAARATKDGRLADEIAAVEVPQRRGEPIVVTEDEGIRGDASAESLAKLRPAFAESGNITAGNASQISDGASAIVVASRDAAERLGVDPLAEIAGYGQVAGPDPSLLHQPSMAIKAAAEMADIAVGEIERFEINEAFAAVVLASMDDLGISHDVVNTEGGAIAMGHPIGASGNRLVLTLAHQMRRDGQRVGAAGLCGGGGQGDAILLRSL